MDSKIKKPSFVVDLSQTMIVSNISNVQEDQQKLYCSCGSSQVYSQKIMRNVVKNYDELTEDSESLESITCDSCKSKYDSSKKVFLITPDKDELYSVDFSIESKGGVYELKKTKNFVNYSVKKKNLIFKEVVDTLKVNVKTKKSNIEINAPFSNKDVINSLFGNDTSEEKEQISLSVNITNVSIFEDFFSFSDSILYTGIEFAYELVYKMKSEIKDLYKFKNIFFLNFVMEDNSVEKSVDSDGNISYTHYVDSGFGDGNKIKKNVVYGDYLFNLFNSYQLVFSIFSFEYSATIILTKSFNFFQKWIESKYLCEPSVYLKNEGTNASKIIETSLMLTKEGKKREELSEIENFDEEEFKVSGTIYNSIKNISDLDVILNAYSNNIIRKHELENILQNYEITRVYNLISKITAQNKRNGESISFKHIEHILKFGLDIEENKSDFITVYADTIRVIGLLELKEKTIFKCKNYISLKEMHDDYSSRFNAMKDMRKAELFINAVSVFSGLNTVIGDVEFEVVPTVERLNLEGLQMQHCIYTYLNRICEKQYLAINVNHLITKERATAGFVRKGDKLELEQLKGFYNSRATAEVIEATIRFCEKNKIKSSGAYDLSVEKSRQREMPGQMSEQQLAELRAKEEKEKQKKDNLKSSLKSEGKEGVGGFFKKLLS